MRRALTIVVLASLTALCQQSSSSADIAKLTPDQTKARDKFEDDVAQSVIRVRQTTGLEPISRIRDKKLRRLSCTFAVRNDALGFQKDFGFPSGFPLAHLEASPEQFADAYQAWLQSHGGKDWPGGPKAARFAVGAWPAQEGGKYWVSFEYHPSAVGELATKPFYDAKNDWKRVVVDPCKKVD